MEVQAITDFFTVNELWPWCSNCQISKQYDLRNCFASNLVMYGVDFDTVRESIGQKDLKMTLRYSHLPPKLKTRAVNVLDAVLTGNVPMTQNPPHGEMSDDRVSEKKLVSLCR
jgi:hypothetical protein